MAYNFMKNDREQGYLLPPNVREWLPEGDLAWFLMDAVAQMDLGVFYWGYREDGHGHPAFEPSIMVTLLLYAYCLGERSSRRIEHLCERDLGFRVVTVNQVPDHTTIARFRQDHQEELADLFTQVLRLCGEAGLVKVGAIAVDGTKVKANASLSANRTYGHLEEEARRILAEAQARDEEEDRRYGEQRGDELPEELRDPRSRWARLQACRERLAREAEEERQAHEARLEQRRAEEEATGQKKRGRKPQAPGEEDLAAKEANVTDPESRIMKTPSGYVQGYNAQAAVTQEQIIVAADVTQEANDVHQLHPLLKAVSQELEGAKVGERPGSALFDAGYWSEENVRRAPEEGPELLVATTKDWKQRKLLREQGCPRGRIPKHLGLRERMERKLLTKRGRGLYKLRSQMVEPVFGQIKEVRRMGRFLRRGLRAVRSEWRLMCATHNLLKLFRSGQGANLTQGWRGEYSPWACASQVLAA